MHSSSWTQVKATNEEKGPWLVGLYRGLYILPSYIGIIINHYKDPY